MHYSTRALDLARNPKNLGRIEAADAQAIVTGPCGDTMEVYLRLNGTGILEATFVTDGCESSLACGNMLMAMVQGTTLEDAGKIQPEDIIKALDGLPEDSAHCAELAVNTLRKAIAHLDHP